MSANKKNAKRTPSKVQLLRAKFENLQTKHNGNMKINEESEENINNGPNTLKSTNLNRPKSMINISNLETIQILEPPNFGSTYTTYAEISRSSSYQNLREQVMERSAAKRTHTLPYEIEDKTENSSSDIENDFGQHTEDDNELPIICLEFPDENIVQEDQKVCGNSEKLTLPKLSLTNEVDTNKKRNDVLSDVNSTQDNESEKSVGVTMHRKMFKRQESSVNEEFLFEVYMVIYLALNLSNREFADYILSTKDQKYGSLGNIILKLKLSNGIKQKYAIQLKYSKRNTALSIENFTDSASDFNLLQYCKQYHSLSPHNSATLKYILCTNRFFQDSQHLETAIRDESDVITFKLVKCVLELDALNFEKTDGTTCQSYKFQIVESKTKCKNYKFKEYGTFFENFVLITKFLEVEELDKKIEHNFKSYSRSNNPYQNFLAYVKAWNAKEGTIAKLSKSVVTEVIALILLSPFIHPFPVKNSKSKGLLKNEILFKTATAQFNVTVLKQKHLNKVKRLWSNVCEELPDIDTLYHKMSSHSIISNAEDSLTDEEMTKALWLLRKCPLVVDNCKDVRRAITLCQQTDLRFILLNDNDSEYDYWMHVFTNLSDLKEKSPQLYEKIIQNFIYFLQGQQMSLKTLIRLSKFDLTKIITPNELICLTDKSFHFQENNFLSLYINRVLPKIVISVQFLETLDDTTVIFITSYIKSSNIQNRFKESDIQFFGLSDKNKIIETNKKCVFIEDEPADLNQLTSLSGDKNFHWFRYFDEVQLEWVKSRVDDINVLEEYQNITTSDCIEEKLLGEYESENNINIICGEAGVGKTSLMKNMERSRLSKWTAFIKAKRFLQHFRDNKHGDVKKFKMYLLDEACKNLALFEKQLLNSFVGKKLVRYIWDEIDDLPENVLTTVLTIVDKLNGEEAKQWLVCQNDLRYRLQKRYSVLARTIRLFGKEEQDCYLQDRLKMTDSQIQKQNWNHSFLRVPLHIFVFTELLREDKNTYSSRLSGGLLISDLYALFVDYHLSKISSGLSKEERLSCYEKIGAYLYLKNNVSEEFSYEVSEHLEQIKAEGDECGIITNVEDTVVEFLYGFLGKYFAVSFLVKNKNLSVQVKDRLLGDNDFRYLFDAMVSTTSKAHRAIILQDLDLLKSCTEKELKVKDKFGRHPLHFACAYGKRYSHLPVERNKNMFIIDDSFIHYQDLTPESEEFKAILKLLLVKCDPCECDDFDEDCLSYADNNNCFFALAVLSEKFQTFFKHEPTTYANVLYYSVRFDNDEVFASQAIAFVKSRLFNKSLLYLAVVFDSYRCLRKMISNSQNLFYIDIVQQNAEKLLKFACKSNKNKIVIALLENGCQIKDIYENDDELNK